MDDYKSKIKNRKKIDYGQKSRVHNSSNRMVLLKILSTIKKKKKNLSQYFGEVKHKKKEIMVY